MTKRTPAELAAHHKAEAAKHERKAALASNHRARKLEEIRRWLDILGEPALAEAVEIAIVDELAKAPQG